MPILQITPAGPQPRLSLSFSRALSPFPQPHFLPVRPSSLVRPAPIRMGGGPRTYPGGVSKWQWKRMQAKKASQLLKARLTRERQIYEMRKRAELKAAVSELERPWEAVEKAPTLFSVRADEQLKVLADRFQRPGGFDMWSDKDGPELFNAPYELPSARFFPKGAVHSVRPYGKAVESEGLVIGLGPGEESGSELDNGITLYEKDTRMSSRRSRGDASGSGSEADRGRVLKKQGFGYGRNQRNDPVKGSVSGRESAMLGEPRVGNGRSRMSSSGRMRGNGAYNSEDSLGSPGLDLKNGGKSKGRPGNKMNSRKPGTYGVVGSIGSGSSRVGFDRKQRGSREAFVGSGYGSGRINRMKGSRDLDAEVHDMSLRDDGSYGL